MRRAWAIAALGLVLASCGGEEEPDRFSLRTPGARTGEPPPAATATPVVRPVTRAEKRVIRGWSNSLRQGRVATAAGYFSLPAEITDNAAGVARLTRRADVLEFNRGLPCGAKLLSTRRGTNSFVVGTFRLTERGTKGASCGASVGQKAVVAFEIRDHHITRWMQDAVAVGTPPAGG